MTMSFIYCLKEFSSKDLCKIRKSIDELAQILFNRLNVHRRTSNQRLWTAHLQTLFSGPRWQYSKTWLLKLFNSAIWMKIVSVNCFRNQRPLKLWNRGPVICELGGVFETAFISYHRSPIPHSQKISIITVYCGAFSAKNFIKNCLTMHRFCDFI